MSEGTFHKVGTSEKRMYGATCILVCGYPPADQAALLSVLQENGFINLPVVFATAQDLDRTLKEILAPDHPPGEGELSGMDRAVILSGFTENELHRLIRTYREARMPPQHWATLTPISEGWHLKDLLKELAAEAEAMKKRTQT